MRFSAFGEERDFMAMTMTETILARHAGKASVTPGENVWVDIDVLMTHDVCGPGTIGVFQAEFGKDAKVWDPDKIVIIPDHYIFTADEKAHRNIEILRQFVRQQNIRYFYDADFVRGPGVPPAYADARTTPYRGVCHVTLPQEGHTRPGEILLGTDSHTCTHGAFGQFATGIGNTEAGFVMGAGKLWLKVPPTMRFRFDGQMPPYLMAKDLILWVIGEIGVDGATYRAMEFAGEAVAALGVEEKMTLCNMAIEAGGKNGIIEPTADVLAYVNSRNKSHRPFQVVRNDAGCAFYADYSWDVGKLEPVVAQPHAPDKRAAVRKLAGTKIDRAYIGSCTGGKLADFVAAAKVLAGQKVAVDTFIVPATVEVDRNLDATTQGGKSLRQIFADAGCWIGPASCAACLGGPSDTFGRMNAPLVCISTTNRNFPGRMGHKESAVYLASPLTVAASAIHGTISDPREFVG